MISARAPQFEQMLNGCFDAEAARRFSSVSNTLARWRARCGNRTPAQVRAWVLASLAALDKPLAPT